MDKKEMKGPLTVSAVMKKVLTPPFRAEEVLRLSLLAAVVLACTQGSFFAYELSGKACRDDGTSTIFFLPCYKLNAADVGGADAVRLGILLCSVPQGAAAALALLLMLNKGKGRRPRSRRALAFVALATATASNCMYARRIGFFLDVSVDLLIAFDAMALVVVQVLDLLGFLALLMGAGRE